MAWQKPTGPISARLGRFLSPFDRSSIDIVGKEKGVLSGNAEYARNGFRRSGSDNAAGYVYYENNDLVWGTGQHTVFMVVEFETDVSSSGFCHDVLLQKSFTSASEPYYVVQIKRSNTTGVLSAQWNNNGTRNAFLTGNNLTKGRYALAFSNRSGRQELRVYSDKGILLGSNSSSHTGAPTNYDTRVRIGGQIDFGTWIYSGAIRFDLFGVDTRAWSAIEIDAFGRDPFGYTMLGDDDLLIGNTTPGYVAPIYTPGGQVEDEILTLPDDFFIKPKFRRTFVTRG